MSIKRDFEFKDKKQNKSNKVILTIYFLILIAGVFGIRLYLEINFFYIALIIFSLIFSFKWLPLKKTVRIHVGISSFVVIEGKVRKEIEFNDVSYIDQNVLEGTKPYYKSITFLNAQFEEIYKLNASGFDYKELVTLCEHIQQTNYEFGTEALEMNNLQHLFNDEKFFGNSSDFKL